MAFHIFMAHRSLAEFDRQSALHAYCALMPAALMIGHHLSISAF